MWSTPRSKSRLAGLTLGWGTFSFLQWNYGRGMLLALLIGAAGGVLGGKAVTPMFLTGPIVAGASSPAALVFAIMAAIAALTIANMSLNRWES